MTVSGLMHLLAAMPPEATVVLLDGDYDTVEVSAALPVHVKRGRRAGLMLTTAEDPEAFKAVHLDFTV